MQHDIKKHKTNHFNPVDLVLTLNNRDDLYCIFALLDNCDIASFLRKETGLNVERIRKDLADGQNMSQSQLAARARVMAERLNSHRGLNK